MKKQKKISAALSLFLYMFCIMTVVPAVLQHILLHLHDVTWWRPAQGPPSITWSTRVRRHAWMLTHVHCNVPRIHDYKQPVQTLACRLQLQHWPWNQMYFDYSIQAIITPRYISETWLCTESQNWKHLHCANHVMEIDSLTVGNVCVLPVPSLYTRQCCNEGVPTDAYKYTTTAIQ